MLLTRTGRTLNNFHIHVYNILVDAYGNEARSPTLSKTDPRWMDWIGPAGRMCSPYGTRKRIASMHRATGIHPSIMSVSWSFPIWMLTRTPGWVLKDAIASTKKPG